MARYINGDKLLEYYEERHKNLCKKNGETDAYCRGYEDAMYVAEHLDFAADVVPRAEVEVLQAELSRYTENVKKMCEQAEAKVAREIFEEIEKTVNACVVDEGLFSQAYFEFRKFNERLAELKKKWEGEG